MLLIILMRIKSCQECGKLIGDFMKIERIISKNKLLAYIIRGNTEVKGKNFLGNPEDFLQVGVMQLDEGEEFKPHYHIFQENVITIKQKVLIILSGKVEASFYDIDKKIKVDSAILTDGDILVILAGGHGFKMLDKTKFVEIKQGPYQVPEDDKKYIKFN